MTEQKSGSQRQKGHRELWAGKARVGRYVRCAAHLPSFTCVMPGKPQRYLYAPPAAESRREFGDSPAARFSPGSNHRLARAVRTVIHAAEMVVPPQAPTALVDSSLNELDEMLSSAAADPAEPSASRAEMGRDVQENTVQRARLCEMSPGEDGPGSPRRRAGSAIGAERQCLDRRRHTGSWRDRSSRKAGEANATGRDARALEYARVLQEGGGGAVPAAGEQPLIAGRLPDLARWMVRKMHALLTAIDRPLALASKSNRFIADAIGPLLATAAVVAWLAAAN